MSLTPEQIADGWIEHDGRGKPKRVEVLYRGGETDAGSPDSFTWRWGDPQIDPDFEIIAYRPEPKP